MFDLLDAYIRGALIILPLIGVAVGILICLIVNFTFNAKEQEDVQKNKCIASSCEVGKPVFTSGKCLCVTNELK